MEDTSPSGACIRLKTPIDVGSKLIVKWQRRNSFSAVARNCRKDGRDFLLGVRRDPLLLQANLAAKDAAAIPPQPQTALPVASQAPTTQDHRQNRASTTSPPRPLVALTHSASRVAISTSNRPALSAIRRARRQQALASYEAGQQKQLEEFEARKAAENAQIQAEMERVTAHYAERIQHNDDQIAQEKETLRNWQMQKQCENQRISEVIELCARQPASSPLANAATASAGSAPSTTPPKAK